MYAGIKDIRSSMALCRKGLVRNSNLKVISARTNLSVRDVLDSLAYEEELPLLQPDVSSMKRGRESDTSLSTTFSESSLNPMPQNEIPRTIAGSGRVRKAPSFSTQTQHPQCLPQHQQPQAAVPPQDMRTSHFNPQDRKSVV